MKRFLLLAAVVGASACSSHTVVAVEELTLEFHAAETASFEEPPEIDVSGGEGRITVEGELSTHCANYSLTADASGGRSITLSVIADAGTREHLCLTALRYFTYQAMLHDVPPGYYQVRVLHVYRWWEGDPAPDVREVEYATVLVG